jgi:hypothetical protein
VEVVALLRHRWKATTLVAVVIAAAVALPLTLLSQRQNAGGPVAFLTDTAATPSGWATVAHGDAQISVPADWHVSTRPVCGRVGLGYVVLGTRSTSLLVRNPRCRQAANMAAILREPGIGGHHAGTASVINGIRVWRVPPVPKFGYVSYAVPALHVLVTARGPLAHRVLETLTRSPLSVVFAPGPAAAVPDGWRWHDFAGIRFAAPAAWPQEPSGEWAGCPLAMQPVTVTLVTAVKPVAVICPPGPITAGPLTAWPGVVVATGPRARRQVPSGSPCRWLHGLRACYSLPFYLGGVLDMSVYVPGLRRPTVVEIGLAGNGKAARAIFDSIQPG